MTLSEYLSTRKRLADEATPGEWCWYNGCSYWRLGLADDQLKHDVVLRPEKDRDGHPNIGCSKENREFIADARTAVPRLVEMVRLLREKLLDEMDGFEIPAAASVTLCTNCHAVLSDNEKHKSNCGFKLALARLDQMAAEK